MNWKAEAKEKLTRYGAMRLATINIPAEIKRLEIDAKRIRAAKTDAPAIKRGYSRREDALLNNMIQRQELAQTLQQAQIWLQATDRALAHLSNDEQSILHRLYIYPEVQAVERLCHELGCETSSVYRRRDRALKHFTLAFYGMEE